MGTNESYFSSFPMLKFDSILGQFFVTNCVREPRYRCTLNSLRMLFKFPLFNNDIFNSHWKNFKKFLKSRNTLGENPWKKKKTLMGKEKKNTFKSSNFILFWICKLINIKIIKNIFNTFTEISRSDNC